MHCSRDAEEALLPTIAALPGAELRVPPAAAEADSDMLEAFKLRAFVDASRGLRAVAVPLPAGKGAMEVEKWPLVQAYGVEGVGRAGFFSMSVKVVDAQPALRRLYTEIDAHAAEEWALRSAAPAMVQQWEAVCEVGDAAARGGAADVSALTADALFESLDFYFDAGTIREPADCVPRSARRDLTAPRAALGAATRALGALVAPDFDQAAQTQTVGECGALHAVLEALAPDSGLRVSRSYFFASGHAAASLAALEDEEDGAAVERATYNASDALYSGADARRLLTLYSALSAAVAEAVRRGEGAAAAEQRLRSALSAAAEALGAPELAAADNIELTTGAVDHLNNCLAIDAASAATHVRFVRGAVLDVTSAERPGESLGALVYCDSGLALGGSDNAAALAFSLTDAVPALRVWRAEGAESRAATRAARAAAALAAGTVPGAPLGAPLGADEGGAAEGVALLGCGAVASVSGSWALYEKGFVWRADVNDVPPLCVRFDADVFVVEVDIAGGVEVVAHLKAAAKALSDAVPVEAAGGGALRFSLARCDTPARRAFVRAALQCWERGFAGGSKAMGGARLVVRSSESASGEAELNPKDAGAEDTEGLGKEDGEDDATPLGGNVPLLSPPPHGAALAQAFAAGGGAVGKAYPVLASDAHIRAALKRAATAELMGDAAAAAAAAADGSSADEAPPPPGVELVAIVGAPGSAKWGTARALCAGAHHALVRAEGLSTDELDSALASAAAAALVAAEGQRPACVLAVAPALASAARFVRALESAPAVSSGALYYGSALLVVDAAAVLAEESAALVGAQAVRGYVDTILVRCGGQDGASNTHAAVAAMRARCPEARVVAESLGRALSDMRLLERAPQLLDPHRRAFLRSFTGGPGDVHPLDDAAEPPAACARCVVRGALCMDAIFAADALTAWCEGLVAAHAAYCESESALADVPPDEQPLRLLHLVGHVGAPGRNKGDGMLDLVAARGRATAVECSLEKVSLERGAVFPPKPLPDVGEATTGGAELLLWHVGGGQEGAERALRALVEALRPPAPHRPPPVEGLGGEEMADVAAKVALLPLGTWHYDGRSYINGEDGTVAAHHPQFQAACAKALAAKRAAAVEAELEADAAEHARGTVRLAISRAFA